MTNFDRSILVLILLTVTPTESVIARYLIIGLLVLIIVVECLEQASKRLQKKIDKLRMEAKDGC